MAEITRNPLCWPNNVARRALPDRRVAQFQERSIATAVNFILAEINRLNHQRWDYGDNDVVISTNLLLKANGLPRADQPEPSDTGAAVFFKLRFKRNGKWYDRPCVLTCDKWRKVADNLWAIGKDIESQRARERWGSTTTEQAFQGYLAIPEQCGGAAWWDMLGVAPAADRAAIEAAFKSKAMVMHPDKGGSHDSWVKVQDAYNQAMARFQSTAA